MKLAGRTQYLLAIAVAAIGPWIIWPGAEVCERQWGNEKAMIFLVVSLFGVILGIVITSDRIPRYKYLVVVIQFLIFYASVFLLKYISYLSV
jgi:hypothetical protein